MDMSNSSFFQNARSLDTLTEVTEISSGEKDDILSKEAASAEMEWSMEKTSGSKKNKSIFTRCIHSFKRAKRDDPESGEIELSNEISGLSIQCIAIGGAIGTGLLIGSGKSLTAGPGSLLISYLLVSTFIYCMCQSLGELTVAMPINGGFANYSSRFIDESWGFAMAWNYCIQWMLLLPMELVAVTMTIGFWPDVPKIFPNWLSISVFFAVIVCLNLLSVKYYGFAEIFFAVVKIVAIMVFAVLALFVDFGVFGEPIGFKYWISPGMFSSEGLRGFIACIITASFSFAGSELVGIAAAESKSPETTIPKAMRQVFWRIGGFYIISLLIVSLVVPYNHPKLVGSSKSNVNASPFVLALSNVSNTQAFASIMNVVILISILSVGNSSIYASSRTLIALSENSQAPRFLQYADKKHRPLIATLICESVGALAYLSVIWPEGSETIFLWLMAISGISVISSYAIICACHLRFRKTLKFNDKDYKTQLLFRSKTGTLGSWYGFILSLVVIIAQIYVAVIGSDGKFHIVDFLQKTLGITIIILFYLCHKAYVFHKKRSLRLLIPLDEISLSNTKFANSTERCCKLGESEVP